MGYIYHVVDKTTKEVVKVGSTIQTLARRWGGYNKEKYSNHLLVEVRSLESSDVDFYDKADSSCPFLWHLFVIEQAEILRARTFRVGVLSNQELPVEQKLRGFDGSEYGRIGNRCLPRDARVRGGMTRGKQNSESGFMSALGKSIPYDQRVKNGSIGGQKRVESGFFSKEHQKLVSPLGAKIGGQIRAKSGDLPKIASLGGHTRWHVNKNNFSLRCVHCQQG